jgi:imidazoleglycerol phosphate synthase glutamine amidotransferase subunit HisH
VSRRSKCNRVAADRWVPFVNEYLYSFCSAYAETGEYRREYSYELNRDTGAGEMFHAKHSIKAGAHFRRRFCGVDRRDGVG